MRRIVFIKVYFRCRPPHFSEFRSVSGYRHSCRVKHGSYFQCDRQGRACSTQSFFSVCGHCWLSVCEFLRSDGAGSRLHNVNACTARFAVPFGCVVSDSRIASCMVRVMCSVWCVLFALFCVSFLFCYIDRQYVHSIASMPMDSVASG